MRARTAFVIGVLLLYPAQVAGCIAIALTILTQCATR